MGHHFQATLLRFYHTKESLHTRTPALPGLECGRVTPTTGGELAHMLRSGKEGLTIPSGNITKPKTMASKFQSSSQTPSPQGW